MFVITSRQEMTDLLLYEYGECLADSSSMQYIMGTGRSRALSHPMHECGYVDVVSDHVNKIRRLSKQYIKMMFRAVREVYVYEDCVVLDINTDTFQPDFLRREGVPLIWGNYHPSNRLSEMTSKLQVYIKFLFDTKQIRAFGSDEPEQPKVSGLLEDLEQCLDVFDLYKAFFKEGETMNAELNDILREMTWGVEVEFDAPMQRGYNEYADFKRDFTEHFPKWIIKEDGSVHNGCEINSPAMLVKSKAKTLEALTQVLDYVRLKGGKTHRTAGIHVHVSLRRSRRTSEVWNAKTCKNILKLFLRHEDMLYRIASSGWSSHRGKDNGFEYCIPLSRMDGVSGLSNADTLDGIRANQYSRYFGCNVQSWWEHNTIEFRIFNTSLNPERVMKYMEICARLLARAVEHTLKDKQIKLAKNCVLYGTMQNETATEKNNEVQAFLETVDMTQEDLSLVLTSDWQ